MAQKKQSERRKHARKDVADTFHLFLVIPSRGQQRFYLKDISEGGVGFVSEAGAPFKEGESFDGDFYINPSLRVPLSFKVAHVTQEGERQHVGSEFAAKSSKAHRVFLDFVQLLDKLVEFLG